MSFDCFKTTVATCSLVRTSHLCLKNLVLSFPHIPHHSKWSIFFKLGFVSCHCFAFIVWNCANKPSISLYMFSENVSCRWKWIWQLPIAGFPVFRHILESIPKPIPNTGFEQDFKTKTNTKSVKTNTNFAWYWNPWLAAFWLLAYLFLTALASTLANSILKDAFTMVPVRMFLFYFVERYEKRKKLL